MGSRDFYTEDECRAMDASDTWRPEVERRDKEIARLNAQVKRLNAEVDRLRLRLDDALDRADAGDPASILRKAWALLMSEGVKMAALEYETPYGRGTSYVCAGAQTLLDVYRRRVKDREICEAAARKERT